MSATHLTDVIHLPRRQPCETSGCSDPKCQGLTPDRRLTLAVIARNANREGVTWGVGVAGAAERRGITRQSAGRQLKWLTEHGLIRPDERQSRDGTTPYLLTYSTPERRTKFDVRGWWFDHLLGLELKAGDTVVLLACAVYANKETLVFTPSLATLARLTGEADRDLRRRLAGLVDAGLLGREVQAHAGRLGRTPEHRRVNVWTLTALVGVEQPVVVISRPPRGATLIPPGGISDPPGQATLIPPRSLKGSPHSENSSHLRRREPVAKAKAKPEPQPAKVADLTASQRNQETARELVEILSRPGRPDSRGEEWAALFAASTLTVVARVIAESAPNLKPEVVASVDREFEVFRFSKINSPGAFLTTRLRALCAKARTDNPARLELGKQHRLALRDAESRANEDILMSASIARRDIREAQQKLPAAEAAVREDEIVAEHYKRAVACRARWRAEKWEADKRWVWELAHLAVAQQIVPDRDPVEMAKLRLAQMERDEAKMWAESDAAFAASHAARQERQTPQAVAA